MGNRDWRFDVGSEAPENRLAAAAEKEAIGGDRAKSQPDTSDSGNGYLPFHLNTAILYQRFCHSVDTDYMISHVHTHYTINP